MFKKQYYPGFILMLLLLVVLSFLDIFLGSEYIPWNDFFQALVDNSNPNYAIIWEFRFPKAITAIIVGIALSVSGLQMQTVFRNPLAGPYVLGISAGAGLGVAITVLGLGSVISFHTFSLISSWSLVIAACIGSALILALILLVSVRIKDIMTILILGIMFGAGTSSFVSILQYFSHESLLKAFVIWSMGSLGSVTMSQLKVMSFVVALGLMLAIISVKQLNTLLLGEEYAKSMGVNVKRTRILIFSSTSLLAGAVTAFCGPIGFIGIVVPHITRYIFKTANHKVILPAVLLTGAIVMLVSDIVSQLPGADITLPINSITAMLGIPVTIWIILKRNAIKTSV